ncbi:threonine dehydratase biosynthetic, chloroplastic-like isoform X2 [Trifolium pratense]|uniref:threonine dehydratase biosynthetic, chloroplastic-like isoform X2 n=1 Tax=Trifolium pratense TaxID=57577 RepID=UPI001E693D0B|nr:threonine dehydratase biosynthetic, chloroplastic-like isoform X2 [Trifolium pratense]
MINKCTSPSHLISVQFQNNSQTMEALQLLSTPQPHLLNLPRHHHTFIRRTTLQPNSFIAAAISKPAEILSSLPLHSSVVSPPLPPLCKVSPDSLQYPPGYVGDVLDRSYSDDSNGLTSPMSYLTNILTSKVYDVAKESPLELAPKLSESLGVNIWLKREDLQPVFSFKLRGAYNMMAKLPEEVLKKGVICSSAGNHAQGVALSAKRLNCNAVIAMPVTTPDIKWKSVERLGATVVLIGDSYDEAQAYAKKRAIEEGCTFIPPFDHPDVIMGQGTIGMEIVRQMKGPIHAIFVPVGGGGLIAGITAYVKRTNPQVKIIGVEPTDANAMALSLHHGYRVILDQVGGFADGVAVKEVGEETFRLCKELVDGIVLVSRDAICASIKDMFEEKRSILEPAGALALAGAEAYCKYYGLKGENVIAITSGANMNFDKLRIVTELANVGRKEEALLLTIMPEVGQMNITEFKYRYNSKEKAVVLYSVGVHSPLELKEIQERMESSKHVTHNLSDVDLVKDHLRHMMGARPDIQNEVLYRFTFPERPGALMEFLDSFSPRWNITLFHYRAQGETGANVLVGMQVPISEMDEFHDHANRLGYEYNVVIDDLFFQLLMH